MAFGVERPDTKVRVRVPGGVVIRPTVTSTQPSKFEVVASLLGQLNAIIAPIQPILSLVRFGQAVVKFATALQGVIAAPPNLTALDEAVDELAESGAAVLALNPTGAVIVFVADTIGVMRALLDGLDEQLAVIEQVQTGAIDIRAKAEQSFVPAEAAALMEADAACLDEVADTLSTSLSDILEPVDLFISVVNFLGSIAGTTVIPSIGSFSGVSQARDAIDAFRKALDAIPV